MVYVLLDVEYMEVDINDSFVDIVFFEIFLGGILFFLDVLEERGSLGKDDLFLYMDIYSFLE